MEFSVEHLLKEANLWADALSRIAAVPPAPFPEALLAAQAVPPPALDVIWQAWVADCPPPRLALNQPPTEAGNVRVSGAGCVTATRGNSPI